MMKRREFITLLSGATAAWPIAARAQEIKNRKIGVLHPGQAAALDARIAAITEGLNSPSKLFGTDLILRLADGEVTRLPRLAVDLVKERVHAIVAAGPPAVQAAKNATASIPVIAIEEIQE